MELSLTKKQIKYWFQSNLNILLIGAIPFVLFFLTVFAVKGYFAARADIDTLHKEIVELKDKENVINVNKQLTENDIDNYNLILSQLIPQQEDYFSIIYALEQLSQNSGFQIVSYSINLKKTTKDKLSLDVSGVGDAQSFMSFLREYNFEGGRLITNENMEYVSSENNEIKLALNFYHNSEATNKGVVTKLKPEDIALLNQIKDKLVIDLNTTQDTSTDYKTSDNPF